MSNEFHSLASDRKVIKIKSALQKADKILDNYNRQDYADSISTGDILSVLNEIDKIAAALRTAYSETVEQDKIEPIYGNLIQIDYDGNILTINVPTLINRDKKNSYYIAGTVAYALNDYIEKHDLKRPIVQTPAISCSPCPVHHSTPDTKNQMLQNPFFLRFSGCCLRAASCSHASDG